MNWIVIGLVGLNFVFLYMGSVLRIIEFLFIVILMIGLVSCLVSFVIMLDRLFIFVGNVVILSK